ncbi:WD repeat-containing protein 26 homolog isoform X2 [Salvia hispanica]|uniref:WD repeat-containing protein 26 homolog isoform X2 n=1 Tax=Salvia hispanica TaxID=49212 RepID=UPI002009C982|nr:WD repeat-containing protein 26 homolog isoform X2 [Salvia hispanica]
MKGVEDESLPKRMKVPSGNIGGLSDSISVGEQGSCSLGGSMALQLASGDDKVVGSNRVISKVGFVRIITEAIYSLGYSKTGKHLEEESGISLHSNLVATFIQQILDGQWDESVKTLHQIDLIDESIIKTTSFEILERKFFELLDGEKEVDAGNTLRTQIMPLNVNRDRAKELSYIMASQSHISLDKTHTQESGLCPRKKFLGELRKLLPPTVVIPEYRLVRLVEQALDFQRDGCRLHNSVGEMSLLVDHQCGLDQIPCQTVQILKEHNDEVWFLKFSHNGRYLASSSRDSHVIIWVNVDGQVIMRRRLTGHGQPVSYISWSPEDDQILTCGEDKTVRRWDIDSGECLCVYGTQNLGLLSCEWAADGKHIYTGVTDKSTRMWDLEGKEVECWPGYPTYRMTDLGIASDGKELVTYYKEDGVVLFQRETYPETVIEDNQTITSFVLSEDGKLLLLSLWNGDLHLYNIDGCLHCIGEYIGSKRSRFVVRSCLGGLKQAFIASGSENSQVYIWHRHYVKPICSLSGHTGAVNCVSWNPANHHMLASASDDRTIRIWGSKQENS